MFARGLTLPVLLAVVVWAGTVGTFRGIVSQPPHPKPGWIFIKATNGSFRAVEISGARVSYADAVPQAERKSLRPEELPVGADVRVTAEQDAAGDWRAREVEVINTEKK